jgi:para-nitrobenzyl esterase
MANLRKIGLALGVACLACASLAGAQGTGRPSVTVEQGRLEGVVEGQAVEAFKGIPFAAPPVGALRWRAPQPAAAWSGTRDAADYGHDCVQNYTGFQPRGSEPAEDCLYLNVWRPVGAKAKLPVLVWIYGGGFVNGSSSRPIYQGTKLASQGLVVVSLNYRLGRFGTFAHPALTRADADKGLLANYGFLDQLAAMRWIQRNIARFGGDPANVTILGESAGGMSVHNLITSPMSHGLFARALIASGGNGSSIAGRTLADAETVGAEFGASQGIAADDSEALAKLRALPVGAIRGDIKLGSVLAGGKRTFSSPFPDGRISVDMAQAYAKGRFNHVPVIIGATSGDIGGREGLMIKGARDLAGVLSKAGVPTWYYRFSYVAEAAPTGKAPGAIHADDLPYYFDTADVKYEAATQKADMAMGAAISSYLVNFAKTGNPNGKGKDGKLLPVWPRYSVAGGKSADSKSSGGSSGGAMMDFSTSGKPVSGKDPWAASSGSDPSSSGQSSTLSKPVPISPSAG